MGADFLGSVLLDSEMPSDPSGIPPGSGGSGTVRSADANNVEVNEKGVVSFDVPVGGGGGGGEGGGENVNESPALGRSRPASVSSQTVRASRGPPCWPTGREGGREGWRDQWMEKGREGGKEGGREGGRTGVEMKCAQGGGRAALPGRGHRHTVLYPKKVVMMINKAADRTSTHHPPSLPPSLPTYRALFCSLSYASSQSPPYISQIPAMP